MTTSRAPAGTALSVFFPPGQRTSIASARLAGHSSGPAVSISLEPEAPAGVLTDLIRGNIEEVLAQEHVLIAVSVEVAHAHAKGRRPLGFCRQLVSFEMIAAVQEYHRS